MMPITLIFIVLCFLVVTNSYITKNDRVLSKIQLKSHAYEKMLEVSTMSKKPVTSQGKLITEIDSTDHVVAQFPFSDEIYEHLKTIISKLTAKIKHDISLSPQELLSLKNSIDSVISDAHRSIRAKDTVSSIERSDDQLDSQDRFSSMSGLRTTWNLPGMENMTTEQYYKALNDRNLRIQQARKEAGDQRPDEYQHFITSLSRK
eukprot:gene3882-4149_t